MADKIVAEYTVKVDKAIKDLEKLAKKVDKVDDERKKTQGGFKSMSGTLSKGFKKLGATIAAAFAVDRIADFTSEAIRLAGELQGVERAFGRINTPNLLNELRKATKGTVSDLELMKQAVRASNFKIPLESLSNLFEFARRRAKETGESVDFLVNSIISGIGRKSPLILDNLGISAVELRKRLKGVGVEAANVGDIAKIIGDIATEELGKMGEEVTTTGDKIIQMQTATENLQIAIGKLLAEKASPFIEFLGNVAGAIEQDITALDKLREQLTGESGLTLLARQTEEIAKLKELEREATESAGKVSDAEFIKLNEKVKTQREIVDAIEQELLNRTANNDETEITVDLINREVEAYRKLNQEQQENSITINSLTEELKNYNKDLRDAEVGSTEFFNILDKVTAKTKELNKAIALTKLDEALKVDVDEEYETPDLSGLDEETEAIGKALGEQVEIRSDGSERIQEIADEQLRHSLEAVDAEDKAKAEAAKREKERRAKELDEFIQYTQAVSSLFSNIAAIQRNINEAEIQQLEERLEKGEISREEFAEKRRQILRQQAEEEKALAIFEATINGAAAVVSAFNEGGPVLAGIVGASVAAQIAAIASQPLPQFEEGGFVDNQGYISGRSHKAGGVLIEAEGGEYITSKKYAQKNKDILEAINSGHWEKYKFENIISPAIEQVLEGGIDNIGASIVLQNKFNDKNMLRAFDRNRSAARQDAQYIVSELSKNFKGRLRGGFA